jgi:cytochrome b involved in lipid metabolism
VLLGEAGRDATEAFEDVGHSDEARALLDQYFVGNGPEVRSPLALLVAISGREGAGRGRTAFQILCCRGRWL